MKEVFDDKIDVEIFKIIVKNNKTKEEKELPIEDR